MKRRPYSRMLVFLVSGLCAAVLLVFGGVMYAMVRGILETEMGLNARGVAVASSYVVMDYVEEYKAFVKAGDEQSAYAQRMRRYFASVKAEGDIRFLFTEARVDADTVRRVLDSEPPDSPYHATPGTPGPNDPQREQVFATRASAAFGTYRHPAWGRLIVAYAPIFDRDGSVLGIVGVHIDSKRLDDKMAAFLAAMIFTLLFILTAIVFLSARLSPVILAPMVKDKLTGVYNKRYLDQFLGGAIHTALRNKQELTVLMMDLDFFKKVNDTYGHAFGDKVLLSFCARAQEMLRRGDCLARYGGEEFIAVLPDASLYAGMAVAERIRRVVENTPIMNEEKDCEVKVTVSIGVAHLDSAHPSATVLIDRADKALYAAKRTRNTCYAYNAGEQ